MMRWLTGERLLATAFAVLGLIFAVKAVELKYMDEFAPGAGFLPFWLALILVALVVGFLVSTRAAKQMETAPPVGRKVLAVSAGLVACVALIEWLGFAVAIAAYILYLLRGVERRSWASAVWLAAGTTSALYLIFKVWLAVPLPQGPWGF
jgi:hypothetical protein